MSVDIKPDIDVAPRAPRALFHASIFGGGPSINNWYWDVAPGGDRMLVNTSSAESGTSIVTIVLNWQRLRR